LLCFSKFSPKEEDCRAEMMKRATAKFSFLKRKNRMVYEKKVQVTSFSGFWG
jgi:hypothetical protein